MNMLDIKDEAELIKFFQKLKIIREEPPLCKNCNVPMSMRPKNDSIDKFTWKCTKSSKCGTTQAIRNDSFLKKCDKHLHIFLKLVYHWSVRTPIKTISKELGISRGTVISWFQEFRVIVLKELDKDNLVLGGNRLVVEIDESLFVKVKHNKGKDLNRAQVWVFGIYERESFSLWFHRETPLHY